tara:strand:+ start:375 stop:944 length:570 start_codon:yes stop_codon:yes gene_type:complete
MTKKSAEDVLSFWFGNPMDPDYACYRAEWFSQNSAFDTKINDLFGDLYHQAIVGSLDSWKASYKSTLALIILLDQFSRNLFRGQARAFEQDYKALKLAEYALEKGYDKRLTHENEKAFLFLPFEHSENLQDQEKSIQLFSQLNETYHNYARRHYEVIKKFGRYPSRNKALGRVTTPEEKKYLEEFPDGF